ncbi:hypothetical protein AJ79_05975 [Helicocarpus griseus UAMH5409]|uniref:Uncharacterized protein n=1 Tax=Helicocarpus griseus UAMH5409 TaxID=1447875 RepID=A0A2B7XH84_9EURO|nr:hypothetical protein AJ79_05975 [Helicocarpus griseus UAMH5409]
MGHFLYLCRLLATSALLYTLTIADRPPLVSSPGDRAIIPGWHLQSTEHIPSDVSSLSLPGVEVSSWYRIGPFATVMAGLVENGVYDDTELFFSDNLNDTTNADKAKFDVPWLYREEFELDPGKGSHYFLQTHGVTSRADIYINGALLASKDFQVGSYGGRNYDITKHVRSGNNCLLVQAYPTSYVRDLAIGFVDWNSYPPDNGTGVWRSFVFSQTGPVSIVSTPRIVTDFKEPRMQEVKVTVKTDVRNNFGKSIDGKIGGVIEAEDKSSTAILSGDFSLGPGEEKTISVEATIQNPKVWWPAKWGEQPLYIANVTVSVDEAISDINGPVTFGIRSVTSRLNSHEDMEFFVNGKPFFVMGAGYTSDIFLRFDEDRVRKQFQYVLDMGLNTVRLEGKHEHSHFYELANRMGLMLLAGWECCNKWEGWTYNDEGSGELWTDADYATANASMLHEAALMQAHPSMLGFLLGSDFWPVDRATKIYVDALERMDWNNPIISSAAQRGFPELVGPSGMKMNGPYDWVPPNYWYGDQLGAAFGFGSELGAGVGSPELASLREFLTEVEIEELWMKPDQDVYHLSRNPGNFDNRRIYNGGLFARYGKPRNLEDYLIKVQITDYEAARAQFESYAARKNAERPATGLIYWMLNSAWPNMHWSLFDYYLKPIGSTLGAKVGTKVEHIAYDYNESALYIINHSLVNSGKRSIWIDVVDISGTSLAQDKHSADTQPNSSKKIVANVPGIDKIRDVAFLKLELRDEEEQTLLSRNVYWLPKTLDVLDWDNSTWYHTPVTSYSDFTALENLAPASVKLSVQPGGKGSAHITLENESDIPAFFMRLNALASNTEFAPIFWSDNYVTLFPHEKMELSVESPGLRCEGESNVVVEVAGFNVEKINAGVC